MNPDHRDRMAFIRICSGRFTKGLEALHQRTGRTVRLAQPQQFMAQDRNIVEEAYAGDIIGIFDPGNFRIGDSLTECSQAIRFEDIPVFPPEHFARVAPADSMKRKQFLKGIEQLAEEGAIQLYKEPDIGTETYIIGVVGVLQFDVLTHRLKAEYKVDIRIQPLNYSHARWALPDSSGKLPDPRSLNLTSTTMVVLDKDDQPVLLFESEWAIDWARQRNDGLQLVSIHGA